MEMRWCLTTIKSLWCFLLFGMCVAVGCMMTVRQGSYKVKCAWRKSRDATMEGCATMQISSVIFGFQSQGGCGRLVFRSMSPMEVQKNPMCTILRHAEFLSKGWF
jgi:hypothetical protein